MQPADVLGRGAAAPAHHVHQTRLAILAQNVRGLRGAFLVLAEGVGEARVRIHAHVGVGDGGELLDVGPQLAAAERAVEPDEQRLRMADRIPERLGGLSRQQPSRCVGNRAGERERQRGPALLEQREGRINRRLGVQGIEHGLDQQQVDAAEQQPARRFQVSGHQLIEADAAMARIVDVGRHRAHAVGGSERAGDEARFAGALRELVGRGAGEACRAVVQLRHERASRVVRL